MPGFALRLMGGESNPPRATFDSFALPPGGQRADLWPETSDEVQSLPPQRQERRGKSIRFRGVRQGNGGQKGRIGGLAGSRIDDVPVALLGRLEGFAPNGRDGDGFVTQGDDGEQS